MPYHTTITKKGQITIPKAIREKLNLQRSQKVVIDFGKRGDTAVIMPSSHFLAVAKKIKVKRKVNPIEARKKLDSSYART